MTVRWRPMLGMSLRRAVAVAVLLAVVTAVGTAAAQQWRRGGWFSRAVRTASPESFDGAFNFCRVAYQRGFGYGGRWSTDYPSADRNLSIRLAELTKAAVSLTGGGDPNHLVVRLTDEELFQCPFVMMIEVGSAYFDEEQAASLRAYLLKGGFLWVDDFWGSAAWANWVAQISSVLPPGEYPIVDLPPNHPLLRTMFEVPRVPQIPSINHWYGSGGGTSERGVDSAEVHARAILDAEGRVMVFMTHNTDIADSWEREGDDPHYFYRFSVDGYALAINVILYAMTH